MRDGIEKGEGKSKKSLVKENKIFCEKHCHSKITKPEVHFIIKNIYKK